VKAIPVSFKPFLVTSDRQLLKLDGQEISINRKPVILKHVTKGEPYMKAAWRREEIKRFCEGDDPDPVQTYSQLSNIVKKYLDFRVPAEVDVFILWIMGTYLHQLFSAYAYLNLYGMKATGKTQALIVAKYIAFNMVLSSTISSSSLFRSVDITRCCVGLDEAENLKKPRDPESKDILRMLKAGYKKEAEVLKTELDSDGHFVPRRYEVYSPKMIASITGIEDILGSRCISINMLRTKNTKISNLELSNRSEDWFGIRHELYCFALLHFKDIRSIYQSDPDIKILLNRDNELWLPLFAISKYLEQKGVNGLLNNVVQYAKSMSEETSDDALNEFDANLVQALKMLLLGDNKEESLWVSAKEIEGKLRELLGDDYSSKYSLTSRIGTSLKNYGFFRNPKFRRRHASGWQYHLSKKHLLDVMDRYGIGSTDEKDQSAEANTKSEEESVTVTATDVSGNTHDLGQIPKRDMPS
jgi:hypothetical protein